MVPRRALVAAIAAALGAAQPVVAQHRTMGVGFAAGGLAAMEGVSALWAPLAPPQDAPRVSIVPSLASFVLPGAGQHLLGQRRKWAYLALEAVGWAFWVERRAAGADWRDRYRDHAWETGRIQSGSRLDGGFPYYETMSHWQRSGAFDTDGSTSGVQPESDVSTYNGQIWLRAMGIHLPGGATDESDPAYQRAIAYYDARAYGTPFLWDWGASDAERAELGRLISESDRRYQHATNVLGAMLAARLASAVDAYLGARGVATGTNFSVTPELGPRGTVWSAGMRIAR
jgi:hypothetical protein